MSVYFAQVGRYIKVGYSENPERRVRNLFKSETRYGAPRDVTTDSPRHLIAAVPGELADEFAAHRALDDFRVSGEWFLDEPEVRTYITGCVAADTVLACYVSRPAGNFDWHDDPVLYTDEDRAWDIRAAEAFSEVMRGIGT